MAVLNSGIESNRIVIVGGGMAGSLLALTLARAGRSVCIVDLRREPAPAFRNEKLGIDQIGHLEALGVLSCFEEACYGVGEAAQPVARRPGLKDCGARYDRWIGRIRAAWPSTVAFVEGKVDRIETSADLQSVVLAGGERVDGRLAVLATGRGERLRAGLGMQRRFISENHSICLGFSVTPQSCRPDEVKARIFHGRFGDGLAYGTIFPMRDELRVNLFSYRGHDDPWAKAMRADPIGVLAQTLPETGAVLAGAKIVRRLEAHSTDLYVVQGHVQSGVVLIGDSFHAPCPASGTGMTRILNDIDRLVNVHIPHWLATPGMDRAKIAAFYADPVKRAVDQASLRRSLQGRGSAISLTPYWRMRRSLGRVKRRLRPDHTALAA